MEKEMTKLPAKDLLDGTKTPETTTGEFRLAMGNLRQFLFELFGDESSDKETARQTLGIDLNELNTRISEKADRKTVEAALDEKAAVADLSLVATTGDYNHLINKPERSDTLEGYGILVDSTPTAGSTRPVTSEGIKNFVENTVSAIRHGMQVFTQSGTFVVPAGVRFVKVRLCGGGGGGGLNSLAPGGTGGTTSFGTFVSATGGLGYEARSGTGTGGAINMIIGPAHLYNYGLGGYSSSEGGVGGSGGYSEGVVAVMTQQQIPVTVGAGGVCHSANPIKAYNGVAGLCVIEW